MNIKSVKYIITNFYVGHRLTAIKPQIVHNPVRAWQAGNRDRTCQVPPGNFPLCLRSLGFQLNFLSN